MYKDKSQYSSNSKNNNKKLRVAIVCPGVGLVQRGFERLFIDIFKLIENDIETTLFKGGGKTEGNQIKLIFASRNGLVPKYLPLHKLFNRTPMHTEGLTFVLALLPYIWKGQFDVVHCIDPPLVRLLYNIRNAFNLKFKILYTEGCAMPVEDYPPADHIHQIAKVTYDDAISHGYNTNKMTLVPAGFNVSRFKVKQTKIQLREKYNIDSEAFVVLSVAAINRGHKRIDYLIEEMAKLKGNFLLCLDGSLDHGDPDLIILAKKKLGDKCKITHVKSEEVGELYKMADLMVHCSIFEAFGLAIIEGAGVGLPMITHNADHFKWLIENHNSWINMEIEDALTNKITSLMIDDCELKKMISQDNVQKRFMWENLKNEYIDLYKQVVSNC